MRFINFPKKKRKGSAINMDQENTTQEQLGEETADLKRVLGRFDLMSMACGQIIGAGVMALVGVGIGYTGRSVNLAFMIAAVFTIMMAIPMIFIGGTIRLKGGNYTIIGALVGESWSGAYMITYFVSNVSIAIYSISFADYFIGLTGLAIPSVLVASICMTLFYVLNIFGIQGAAIIQNAMVVILAAALVAFMAFGVGKVNWNGAFGGNADWMTGGMNGLFMASATLTYATGGATVILNFGAEAKNPTKDIPFVIIVSTLAIAAIYGVMATVAAGVLPVADVAGKSLLLVAKQIFPAGIYEFFIIGGAMFALTTTLNATLGWVTKPLLQACIDGWFPKALGYVHPKYKTPIVLLTIFYVLGMIPILTGISLSQVTTIAQIVSKFFTVVLCIAVVNLPKKMPEIWAKSGVHCSNGMLWFVGLLGAGSTIAQWIILASNQATWVWIANFILIAVAFVYAYIMKKSGKVTMNVSYEAA